MKVAEPVKRYYGRRSTAKFIITWFVAYLTIFTTWAFILKPDIPDNTVKLLMAIMGMTTVVSALYQYMREKDEQRNDKNLYVDKKPGIDEFHNHVGNQ